MVVDRGRLSALVDGVFGVATWNPGIRVSRGSLGRSSIDSQRDTPSSAVSWRFRAVELVYAKPTGSVHKRKVSVLHPGKAIRRNSTGT